MDTPSVAAAFLHDVIEDTPATADDIRKNFGDEILTLVEGVTKLDKIRFQTREDEDAENFRKIFVAMANDVRVIIIKLADRLHNMRSLLFELPLAGAPAAHSARNFGYLHAPRRQAGHFADKVRT